MFRKQTSFHAVQDSQILKLPSWLSVPLSYMAKTRPEELRRFAHFLGVNVKDCLEKAPPPRGVLEGEGRSSMWNRNEQDLFLILTLQAPAGRLYTLLNIGRRHRWYQYPVPHAFFLAIFIRVSWWRKFLGRPRLADRWNCDHVPGRNFTWATRLDPTHPHIVGYTGFVSCMFSSLPAS